MARALTAFLLPLFLLQAQDAPTRAGQIEQKRAELARQPLPPDEDVIERGIEWAYEHKIITLFTYGWKGVMPTFGGLLNDQGFAAGAQFLRHDLRNGGLTVRASARGTLRTAYLLDAEVGAPHLAGGRMFLDFYARQRNNPQVSFFGIGPDTADDFRTAYLLEDTTLQGTFGVRPGRFLWFGATGGYLKTNVGPTNSDKYPSVETFFTPALLPGVQRQPDFLRGGVFSMFDYRDNPLGPRAGGLYYGRFDYYDDRDGNLFSFRRLTAEAQQFVPLFNKKRVIALRGKTIFSYRNPNQDVPFYLQPTLGSSDDLRGYNAFRFLDRNSLVLNAEWRWEVLTDVEAAVFFDAGKVFSRPGQINFSNLRKSYGGGLRFRAPGTGATAVRFDIAASAEGVHVWLVFNDIFATPAIRTGRESSPPPGRLP